MDAVKADAQARLREQSLDDMGADCAPVHLSTFERARSGRPLRVVSGRNGDSKTRARAANTTRPFAANV